MTRFGRRALLALPLLAAVPPGKTVRVGALRFGSVHWELNVMQAHQLDAQAGIKVEIVELTSASAGQVALQSGRVDTVVQDWLWVSRQRSAGADWSFVPTSCALGGIVGAQGSPVHSLSDLPGHRLGVAGSPIDKSWLLLRAYARWHLGLKLDKKVQATFGAPPVLAEQLLDRRIDAALTFWPFVARAQAAGLPVITGMDAVVRGLDVGPGVPFTGFVFSESWALDNQALLDGFVTAARHARTILAEFRCRVGPDRVSDASQRSGTHLAGPGLPRRRAPCMGRTPAPRMRAIVQGACRDRRPGADRRCRRDFARHVLAAELVRHPVEIAAATASLIRSAPCGRRWLRPRRRPRIPPGPRFPARPNPCRCTTRS